MLSAENSVLYKRVYKKTDIVLWYKEVLLGGGVDFYLEIKYACVLLFTLKENIVGRHYLL